MHFVDVKDISISFSTFDLVISHSVNFLFGYNITIGYNIQKMHDTAGERATRQLHKNAASNIEQVLEATPHKAPTVTATYLPSLKLSKLHEPDMQDTAREAGTSS